MSGPIVPPLEVTEVDGSPDGRPITKIIVSNGDLTVSGRTATIDTTGSTTTPGGSDGQVQYNDSGAFGASTILATNKTTSVTITSAATDNDMTLNVVGDGAGTPIINLKNSTKEVRLTCEDDDKLYVRGPTSGERFTFDVSSATGGITFPDSTTQTTAATASAAPSISPYLAQSTGGFTRYKLANQPFYSSSQSSFSNQSFSTFDRTHYYPFIAPESGDVTEVGMYPNTATTSADMYVGIYDGTDEGKPNDLLGYATFDLGSAGDIYQTSLSATVTLVAGNQYFYGMVTDSAASGGNATGISGDTVPSFGIWNNTGRSGRQCCWKDSWPATQYVLPTTAADFNPSDSDARMLVSIKVG